jgi:hypothetical protein
MPPKAKKRPSGDEIDDIFSGAVKSANPLTQTKLTPKADSRQTDSKRTSVRNQNPSASESDSNSEDDSHSASDSDASEKSQNVDIEPDDNADDVAETEEEVFARLRKAKAVKTQKRASSAKPDDDDGFFDSRGLSKKRKTVDGLTVYSEAELGIGKGGNTAKCPFDCDCCF